MPGRTEPSLPPPRMLKTWPPPAGGHAADGDLGAVDGAEHVGATIVRTSSAVVSTIGAHGVGDAGVVDPEVDAAERRDRGVPERLDLGGVGDVGELTRSTRPPLGGLGAAADGLVDGLLACGR